MVFIISTWINSAFSCNKSSKKGYSIRGVLAGKTVDLLIGRRLKRLVADERTKLPGPDHTTVYTRFVTHILVRINGDDILDGRTYATDRTFVGIDWRGRDIETDPGHLQCQYNWDDQGQEQLSKIRLLLAWKMDSINL